MATYHTPRAGSAVLGLKMSRSAITAPPFHCGERERVGGHSSPPLGCACIRCQKRADAQERGAPIAARVARFFLLPSRVWSSLGQLSSLAIRSRREFCNLAPQLAALPSLPTRGRLHRLVLGEFLCHGIAAVEGAPQ